MESIVEAVGLREDLCDELGWGDDLSRLSQLSYLSAPLSDVRDAAERGLAVLGPLGPSTQLAWACANRAQLAGIEYDRSGAAYFGQKAEQLALVLDDVAVANWARLAQAFSDIAAAQGSWDCFDAAWRTTAATPRAAEHAAMIGVFGGFVATLHHDFESADRCLVQTSQLCRENNLIGFELMARVVAAVGLLDRGSQGEAEAVAEEILGQPALSRLHYLWAQVVSATAKARSGCDGVWPLLDGALSSDGLEDPMRAGIVWAARIEAAWLADDAVRTKVEAERALASLTDAVDGWIVGRIWAWAQIAGMPLPELPCPPAGPYALQLDGDWDAAADLWMHMGCPYNAAIARMHSDTPGASSSAPSAFESLGAGAAAARARRGLRKRRGRATGTDRFGFTGRERQVADLLATRYSDREIADTLFISPKTAGNHVSAIFAKLGVRSRAAARERLCEGMDTVDLSRESPTGG
jgi:DNA-binding CsgD family transcriptional regulator